MLPGRTVLTVRGEREDQMLFLGADETVAVFETVGGLARYCRDADEHELTKLEFWDEIRDADEVPDDRFRPGLGSSFDLTTPNSRGGVLLLELMDFCGLDADEDDLAEPADPEAWEAAVEELDGCLQQED